MTAKVRPAGEACRCGHALDRHDGIKTTTRDACAGGTPGFCGCSSYRPAPVTTRTAANGDLI